ncbi:MAG TPA: phage portal protein [Beijerinckiaceae bacterium]|nr:phage portal protein [Beijerinckiaceae bacterium]
MQSLFRLAASLVPGWQRPKPTDERVWTGAPGPLSRAGVPVSSEAVLQLDVVQAVQENLGGVVSSLPVGVFRRGPDGEREPDRAHRLHVLLNDRPNPRQTAQEHFDEQQRHLSTWRNAYARLVPADDGHPIGAIEPIHPSRLVKIERGEGGRVFYTFSGLGTATQEVLRDDQVWHVRKAPLTVDGLRGVPVWESAREVFGRAIAVREYGADFFRNSGLSGGVLEHPGTFKDKEARAEFLEAWREGGTGANRHRDRLLLHGVKYNQLVVKNNEAQFLETAAATDVQVCRLWNMPPHRVGILDRATFSNIEQQSIDYVVYTLAPWICAWEQAAHRDLLIGEEQDTHFVEINVAGLLRGDLAARYKAYAVARQWGWLSVNDIRRLENQNGIGPDGDIYLQPLNMGEAGDPEPEPEPKKREES